MGRLRCGLRSDMDSPLSLALDPARTASTHEMFRGRQDLSSSSSSSSSPSSSSNIKDGNGCFVKRTMVGEGGQVDFHSAGHTSSHSLMCSTIHLNEENRTRAHSNARNVCTVSTLGPTGSVHGLHLYGLNCP